MEIGELLKKVDIVEVASMFTDLEERSGEFWGISPLTYPPEKTPSFSVRRETGKFYDFSSGKGGSCITLLQLCMNISTKEAIEQLKKIAGVTEDINVIYREKLDATKCCLKYAKPVVREKPYNPSVLPPDYMERFEIRPDKLKIWEDEGISQETMRQFDIRYDSFTDQIVYPVKDLSGDLINVGYRVLDPLWKEKGMHKYGYRKSFGGAMNILYGLYDNLDEIKRKHEIIIFEGCKSVLKAYTWGYKNAAALSTSHLSAGQMKILMRLGCDAVFMLDREIKIREDHNIKTLKNYVNCYYYYDYKDLLGEKDAPVDKGKEVFETLYEGRLRYR